MLHFSLPEGLEDVAKFPDLIAELLRRNYTEEEVKKVVGENLIRVFEKAEEVSVIIRKIVLVNSMYKSVLIYRSVVSCKKPGRCSNLVVKISSY